MARSDPAGVERDTNVGREGTGAVRTRRPPSENESGEGAEPTRVTVSRSGRHAAAEWTLNHALQSGHVRVGGLVYHSDKGCQYTALRLTQRLHDAGVTPSTGTVGDSVDNALAHNLWSSIKTVLLHRTCRDSYPAILPSEPDESR